MSSAAIGSRPTQPGADLPPVQADQSSLERDTMLPMMGLLDLLEATIGSETGGVGDAVTGSEVGVGDAISERMEEELGKIFKGEVVQST
jgi:hypothetical protein